MNIVHLSTMFSALLLLFCTAISSGMPIHTAVRHRLLSHTTGRYLAVTKSGRVHANGQINNNNPDKDPTPIVIDRFSQTDRHVRIASVKFASRGWFLVLTPGESIRGQVPHDGNEVFEEVPLPGGFIALKALNYNRIVHGIGEEEEGGSGAIPVADSDDGGLLMPQPTMADSDTQGACYIGFPTLHEDSRGRVRCYDNVNNNNVRLRIIPHE